MSKIRITEKQKGEIHVSAKKPLEERLADQVDKMQDLENDAAERQVVRSMLWRIDRQLSVVSGQATAIGLIVLYLAVRVTFCG